MYVFLYGCLDLSYTYINTRHLYFIFILTHESKSLYPFLQKIIRKEDYKIIKSA